MQELRQRARRLMDQGAVASGSEADRKTLIRLLNGVLATWSVCILRHKGHCQMASGIHSGSVTVTLPKNAKHQQNGESRIAKRKVNSQGALNLDSALFAKHRDSYAEGKSLLGMIREDLAAERIAVESYSEITRYLGDRDPTTRTMMDKIVASGERHADEMTILVESLGADRCLAARA
jgi:bacterioferritin